MYDESVDVESDDSVEPSTTGKKLSSKDFILSTSANKTQQQGWSKMSGGGGKKGGGGGSEEKGQSGGGAVVPPSTGDEEEEEDEELNSAVANIEGFVSGRTYSEDDSYFIDEEEEEEEENDSAQLISPYVNYPGSSFTDPQALGEYAEQKEIWELQLDLKRQSIADAVRQTAKKPGVHSHRPAVYNPDDYKNLSVNQEIKEIFSYITKVTLPPLNGGIDVKLHPFIPDYYPAVGDIDAFIKVVESGVNEDGLGVRYLDEPAPFQSDPSVLDLRLRALAKQSSAKSLLVKKVDNVGKSTKVIDTWITDISDLHRSKPSPSVHYSKPMPDVDTLMQEWPPEVEEALKAIQLPPPNLNCELSTYVDIVCNLLDIPVYKSRVQSLHALFTLYATQKQFSSNFSALGGGDFDLEGRGVKESRDSHVDHLHIQ